MKTTLDVIDVLFDVLKSSSLNTATTGKVYKLERPVNSVLEDVVINSLPVTGEQVQRCIANVNIFVVDQQQIINGESVKVPNVDRMQALAALAVQNLKDGINGLYTWDVQQQRMDKDEESNGQHYVNLRIQFYISNI